MAATGSLPSSSLSPSQSLNSSHSSDGSCSFVVVENTSSLDENAQVSQLNGEDKQEMMLNNESTVEAGSASHEDLIQRVQRLTQENEKLKGVLIQNNKLLEVVDEMLKGYDEAKEGLQKLQEKNQSLKTELKSEQIKNQQLEEQVKKFKEEKLSQSSSEVENKPSTPKQLQSLNQEIKRLVGEKTMLEINNSKLQEHISCLRTSIHEAEKSTMEGDEWETLVSMGSLIPSSDQTSMESMQSRYSKLETDKEILLVDLQKLTIEKEQIKEQYENLEEEHKLVRKHLAELEQTKTSDDAAVVESGQESSWVEGTVLQANHTSSETTQHVEQEGADIKKLNEEILNLTHERDSYKKELDALQTHLEAAKPSQEEVLGDADLKEKYLRVKTQLWKYQERDNYIQDKENAFLEKEEAYNQKLVKQGKDLQRQLAEVRKKEEALTQEKQRHQEEIKILGETHEHEVLLLKEDLHTKSEAMAAVQTNEKCLREQLLKLQLENQNLVMECEKCRADLQQHASTRDLQSKLEQSRAEYQELVESYNRVLDINKLHKQCSDLQRQLAEVAVKEEALTREKQRHEEEIKILKKRLGEIHKHEVLLSFFYFLFFMFWVFFI
ncbi:uncharacterized protein [Montipora capricornis]|uniref:uncharacterized protein n=1 Tax=Montipora capricornis TaxID=246305 RepID=UPI0035F1AE80